MRLYLHSTTVLRYDWNQEVKISRAPGHDCLALLFVLSLFDGNEVVSHWRAQGAWCISPPVDIKAGGRFVPAVARFQRLTIGLGSPLLVMLLGIGTWRINQSYTVWLDAA
jgi:hypothetical protein